MSKFEFIYKNTIIRTLVKMLLIIVTIVFALNFWLEYYTNHGQKIAVPNVSKMSLLKMKLTLEKANLTYKIQDTVSFNPNFPPNTITEQSPAFGEYVKEQRKIYVKLNPSGYKKIKIPAFYGKPKRQIILDLTSLGFAIGGFSYVPDKGKDVVRGLKFNGQKLKEGDQILKRSKIDIVFGKGVEYIVSKTDTLQVEQ